MRRVVPTLLCLTFAASLHASVPAGRQAQFTPSPTDIRPEQPRSAHGLPLTAAPVDRQSFFAEFYSAEPLQSKNQRKAGLFKRFTTLVKKTAQKVNFFD